jgi:hypothetical protein
MQWGDLLSEIKKEIGIESSMSGTVKGWKTPNGTFICRVCTSVSIFSEDESDINSLRKIAKANSLAFEEHPDYIEMEVSK